MSNLRKNLTMGIDSRLTGDQEVMTLKTTSSDSIVIQFNSNTNVMDVHPDDLQNALNEIKDFVASRTKQPPTLVPEVEQLVGSSEPPPIKSAFDENTGISKLEESKKSTRGRKKKVVLDEFLPEAVQEESELSQN